MRSITEADRLVEGIAGLYESCPGKVRAIALEKAHEIEAQDDMPSLDIVIIVDADDVLESAAQMKDALRPILEKEQFLTQGPTWKNGFGACFNYLYADGFTVDISVNNLNSLPASDRVLQWVPLRGDHELAMIKRLVEPRLAEHHQVNEAIFDLTYHHMSLCRHISRKEIFAANAAVESLTSALLALALLRLRKAYDPRVSCKRIVRDGLAEHPAMVEIRRLGEAKRDTLNDYICLLHRIEWIGEELMEQFVSAEPAWSNWAVSKEVRMTCHTWYGQVDH